MTLVSSIRNETKALRLRFSSRQSNNNNNNSSSGSFADTDKTTLGKKRQPRESESASDETMDTTSKTSCILDSNRSSTSGELIGNGKKPSVTIATTETTETTIDTTTGTGTPAAAATVASGSSKATAVRQQSLQSLMTTSTALAELSDSNYGEQADSVDDDATEDDEEGEEVVVVDEEGQEGEAIEVIGGGGGGLGKQREEEILFGYPFLRDLHQTTTIHEERSDEDLNFVANRSFNHHHNDNTVDSFRHNVVALTNSSDDDSTSQILLDSDPDWLTQSQVTTASMHRHRQRISFPPSQQSSRDSFIGVGTSSSRYDSSERRDSMRKRRQSSADYSFRTKSTINVIRNVCGTIVNNTTFQTIIIILIALNALSMGLATMDFVTDNEDVFQVFEITDMIFLIIFTTELALELTYRGVQLFFDPWLVFDFTIIVASWALENFQIVRAFRIFRAFRLVSRLELLKNLVEAVLTVMPKMSAIAALLVLIIYVYSVLCTDLFEDLYEEGLTDYDYFSRLDRSAFTLFQFMTLDWSIAARQTKEKHPWAWVVYIPFILVSAFIVYNLIVAVVCDTVVVIEAFKAEQRDALAHGGRADNPEIQRRRLDRLRKQMNHMMETQIELLDHVERVTRSLELLNGNNRDDQNRSYRYNTNTNTNTVYEDTTSYDDEGDHTNTSELRRELLEFDEAQQQQQQQKRQYPYHQHRDIDNNDDDGVYADVDVDVGNDDSDVGENGNDDDKIGKVTKVFVGTSTIGSGSINAQGLVSTSLECSKNNNTNDNESGNDDDDDDDNDNDDESLIIHSPHSSSLLSATTRRRKKKQISNNNDNKNNINNTNNNARNMIQKSIAKTVPEAQAQGQASTTSRTRETKTIKLVESPRPRDNKSLGSSSSSSSTTTTTTCRRRKSI